MGTDGGGTGWLSRAGDELEREGTSQKHASQVARLGFEQRVVGRWSQTALLEPLLDPLLPRAFVFSKGGREHGYLGPMGHILHPLPKNG